MKVGELVQELVEHCYTFEYKYFPHDVILLNGLNLVSFKIEKGENPRHTFYCESWDKKARIFSAYDDEKIFSRVQVLATIKEILPGEQQ